jgi:hypothetical protein
VSYVGAGTFEFIANQDNLPYFMEMDTRKQVRHRLDRRLATSRRTPSPTECPWLSFYLLEGVDVEEHDGQREPMSFGRRNRLFEARVKVRAIRQTCESVMQCLVTRRLLTVASVASLVRRMQRMPACRARRRRNLAGSRWQWP